MPRKVPAPRTVDGKRRSRRNAVRHGLTAESVVTVFEDETAYRKFERTIIADYAPETALASLALKTRRSPTSEQAFWRTAVTGKRLSRSSQGGHLADSDKWHYAGSLGKQSFATIRADR